MSKKFLFIIGLVVSTISAQAAEWSYSKVVGGFTTRVYAAACYGDGDGSKVSFDSTFDGAGYDSISTNASCGCNQALVLNGDVVITANSFSELVEKSVPAEITSYSCKTMAPGN